MMARSNHSNQRPDTLMQDRSPLSQRRLLQRTAGPYSWVSRAKKVRVPQPRTSAAARKRQSAIKRNPVVKGHHRTHAVQHDQRRRLSHPLRAACDLQARKERPPRGRSLPNPIRCFDQAATRAARSSGRTLVFYPVRPLLHDVTLLHLIVRQPGKESAHAGLRVLQI